MPRHAKLTRADGSPVYFLDGVIIEAPTRGLPAEARTAITYGGVTRNVRERVEEVLRAFGWDEGNRDADSATG